MIGAGQCSKLLNARDARRRTPLILAIEAGLYPLARRLVELELDLPANLRSFGNEDVTGRNACDHATASDDQRISGLARAMRTQENTMEDGSKGGDDSIVNQPA